MTIHTGISIFHHFKPLSTHVIEVYKTNDKAFCISFYLFYLLPIFSYICFTVIMLCSRSLRTGRYYVCLISKYILLVYIKYPWDPNI